MVRFILVLFLVCSCRPAPASDGPRSIPSTPIGTTGALARRLLATPGFTWHSTQSAHARLHFAANVATGRVHELADSVERAREVALALLDEREIANEALLELFLVETRDDMRRLIGAPVGGGAFPGELTAVFVADADYRPFFRHELTHAYAAHRWGRRQSGPWLDEGLAALATGVCHGHSIDAVAAGYIMSGDSPTLLALTGNFRAIPELPGYFTAASLADFLRHRDGIAALRSIWRGERSGADSSLPLGPDTKRLWSDWRHKLAGVPPATLDTARLRRDGC